jgi:DNA (cytosine-5)-methyltransferase 1
MAGGMGGDSLGHWHIVMDKEQNSMSTKGTKPPYRIPSMNEIRALPWNGFNAISTFSGCGGSSLGYKMAGFKVLWASEFIPAAQDTYRANHIGTHLDTRDIRTVTPKDILTTIGMKAGELDLLDGSPPCASFSTAGKRQAGWGKVKKYSDTEQRTDDLFFEFSRILRGIKPKVFVAENVSGLVKGTAKGYFLEILKELKSCGYKVGCRVLDAQWLGVPQTRQRTIFVGVRDDLFPEPCHPSPLPYRYSVREALSSPIVSAYEDTGVSFGMGDITDRAAPTVRAGGVVHLYEEEVRKIRTAQGGFGGPGKEIWKEADVPYPTIGASPATGNNFNSTGGQAEFKRPSGKTVRRKFTIQELKRICSFPDDFILTGTYAKQWERLGRAVPPLMMKAIAETVRDEILKKA